jgi:integrase
VFFSELPLNDVHIGHVEQYQKWRQEPRQHADGSTHQAGPSEINHEINTLAQILGRAGLWMEIKKFYRPLPLPKKPVGKALTDEEEERLFIAASADPRWKVAYCASLLTVNTSAGPGEILQTRLRDVDVTKRTLTIWERIKNEYRERTVWLNDTALWAVQTLLKRANDRCGAHLPENYLLPIQAGKRGAGYDPTRPMITWKHAWQSLRRKADLPHLRQYDLRHHVITKLLENPDISDKTAQEIAGHISDRMQQRYSHIRLQRKRAALEAVETKSAPQACQLSLNFGGLIEFPRFKKKVEPEVPIRDKKIKENS